MNNPYEFLKKLGEFYPADEPFELYQKRIKKYAEILHKINQSSVKKIDYDKTFDSIVEHREYRNFPLFPDIIKYAKYLPVENNNGAQNIEPRKYTVTRGGYEYVFEEVPSTWEDVHSTSEFENIKELPRD